MGAKARLSLFMAGLFMLAFGYWASTFASVFIEDNRPLMFGLFFFGLCMLVSHAFISAIAHAKIEKRLSALEGDPELPPKPQ